MRSEDTHATLQAVESSGKLAGRPQAGQFGIITSYTRDQIRDQTAGTAAELLLLLLKATQPAHDLTRLQLGSVQGAQANAS